MAPLTITGLAIGTLATVLAIKPLEKIGENIGQAVWDKTSRFLESLRKQSPETVTAIEKAPQQPLDYAKVVLQLEAAAKENTEVSQAMEHLVTTVNVKDLPNFEKIIQDINKALESHQAKLDNYNIENVKNFFRGNISNKGNTNFGDKQTIFGEKQTIQGDQINNFN